MSNYRSGYVTRGEAYRHITPKQRRRLTKKQFRDEVGIGIGNPTQPAPLSGHPGRRRAQLAERQAIAEEREIARALRKQAEIEGRVAA